MVGRRLNLWWIVRGKENQRSVGAQLLEAETWLVGRPGREKETESSCGCCWCVDGDGSRPRAARMRSALMLTIGGWEWRAVVGRSQGHRVEGRGRARAKPQVRAKSQKLKAKGQRMLSGPSLTGPQVGGVVAVASAVAFASAVALVASLGLV